MMGIDIRCHMITKTPNAVRRLIVSLALLVAVFVALTGSLNAATSESFADSAVEAHLITAENGVTPGATTLSAGLHLQLGENWKTYWRSPGEVGFPPSIDWAGSQNVADVSFLWPAPERFTAFGIENFGYHDEVVFPLRVTLSEPGAPARLSARVNLLICSTVCVPQDFNLSLTLPRASGIDDAAAALISAYADKVPDDGVSSGISIETAYLNPEMTALTLTARSDQRFVNPDVFPELGEGTAFGKPDIRLGDNNRLLWVELPILTSANEPTALQITVTDGNRAATLTPDLSEGAAVPPFRIDQTLTGFAELAWIAVIALLGGLILNVMPCVLPVLSIKLSSALRSPDQSPARIRKGFAVSALGVLAFMWALAAATLVARSFGMTVGWGLQFQNPVFLTVMFVILVIFSANLFGAFEFTLPSSLQTQLVRAGGGKGYGGDFATGAFASILATPCSAPFLGTAVAFALAGRTVDIAVIFTALGLGLALPYLIIAAFPQMVTRLPKPGRWMIWLKILLGLALAGTAGWLMWVLNGVAGQQTALWIAGMSLTVVVFLSLRRLPSFARVMGAIVLSGVAIMLAGLMSQSDLPTKKFATNWSAFDRSEIARQISQGNVVFVDVTADWCLTCKANKVIVLDREPVISLLRRPGTISMQADWTRPDETISRYLEGFGRYGIPFNAVYGPAAPDGIVLPELLTADAVVQALEDARGLDLVTSRN
ncbi:thioredoxin family protein [Rhodobacteraceae bacterium LMO-12]|nr:thioredoxin family protein [Rhodobacteraceae bacterium LMO-JJ12]